MAIELSNQAKRQWITIAAAIPVTLFLVLDMMDDYRAGVSVRHLFIEAAFWICGLTPIGLLLKGWNRARRSLGDLEGDLARTKAEAERLKAETLSSQGMNDNFGRQFEQWQLSPAERDVALLLLKGLSYQQIAASRNAAEGTVRQQALSVYRKAGLSGRSELAAFFLEDLLVLPPRDDDARRHVDPSK